MAYDLRQWDEDRYLTAIARRNTTWARWRQAEDVLADARAREDGRGLADLRVHVAFLNAAQSDHEHAERDLVRARVWWRAQRREATSFPR